MFRSKHLALELIILLVIFLAANQQSFAQTGTEIVAAVEKVTSDPVFGQAQLFVLNLEKSFYDSQSRDSSCSYWEELYWGPRWASFCVSPQGDTLRQVFVEFINSSYISRESQSEIVIDYEVTHAQQEPVRWRQRFYVQKDGSYKWGAKTPNPK